MSKCPFVQKSKEMVLYCYSPDNPENGVYRNIEGLGEVIDPIYLGHAKCYREVNNIECPYNFDLNNKKHYGPNAPIFCERIWIDPMTDMYKSSKRVNFNMTAEELRRIAPGRVIEDHWPSKLGMFFINSNKYKYCRQRYVEDFNWEETIEYKQFLERARRKNKNLSDETIRNIIAKRYQQLDDLFSRVKNDRKLLTREELGGDDFREENGILIHLGPNEEIIVCDGFHRLSIARILELNKVPALLGFTQVKALGFLNTLRGNKKN